MAYCGSFMGDLNGKNGSHAAASTKKEPATFSTVIKTARDFSDALEKIDVRDFADLTQEQTAEIIENTQGIVRLFFESLQRKKRWKKDGYNHSDDDE
jgi:hypothetical protein